MSNITINNIYKVRNSGKSVLPEIIFEAEIGGVKKHIASDGKGGFGYIKDDYWSNLTKNYTELKGPELDTAKVSIMGSTPEANQDAEKKIQGVFDKAASVEALQGVGAGADPKNAKVYSKDKVFYFEIPVAGRKDPQIFRLNIDEDPSKTKMEKINEVPSDANSHGSMINFLRNHYADPNNQRALFDRMERAADKGDSNILEAVRGVRLRTMTPEYTGVINEVLDQLVGSARQITTGAALIPAIMHVFSSIAKGNPFLSTVVQAALLGGVGLLAEGMVMNKLGEVGDGISRAHKIVGAANQVAAEAAQEVNERTGDNIGNLLSAFRQSVTDAFGNARGGFVNAVDKIFGKGGTSASVT